MKPKTLIFAGIWTGIVVLAFFPQVSHYVSQKLGIGIGDNLNVLIFAGFVVSFAFIHKLIHDTDHLEQTITKLVRTQALLEIKRNRRRRGN